MLSQPSRQLIKTPFQHRNTQSSEFEDEDIVPPSRGISIAWHKVPHQLGGWAAWNPKNPDHMIAYKQLLHPEGDGRFYVIDDQVCAIPFTGQARARAPQDRTHGTGVRGSTPPGDQHTTGDWVGPVGIVSEVTAAYAGSSQSGRPPFVDATPAQIRDVLAPEDAAEFDRQWRDVLNQDRDQLDLSEVHEVLAPWRRIAWLTVVRGPQEYRQTMAAAERRLRNCQRSPRR